MSFMTLPPEINSLRMFSGAGSAPLLEAAAAWEGLASELGSAASSFSSVTSSWRVRPGRVRRRRRWWPRPLRTRGGLTRRRPRLRARRGRRARWSVRSRRRRRPRCSRSWWPLNRNSFVQMVMSNWFGLNAPAIAQLESEYEPMWAQDVAAMSGYHAGVSAAAAQLTPVQSCSRRWRVCPDASGQVNSAAAYVGFNLGLGNQGTFNLGNGNIGMYNVGSGNNGSNNIGGGNGSRRYFRQRQRRQREHRQQQHRQRKHRHQQHRLRQHRQPQHTSPTKLRRG